MSDESKSARMEVEIDEAGISVYISVIAGTQGCSYSKVTLNKLLDDAGLIGMELITSAHKDIEGLLKENKEGKVKLGEKVDALVEVIVAPSLLSAKLRITSARGGKQAGVHEVVEVLHQQQIEMHRVNKKHVVGLILKAKKNLYGDVIESVIARGEPAKDGEDSRFELLIDEITHREPNKRTDGTLDYYDLGPITCVKEGEELMRKIPPVHAIEGTGVTGETLKAKPGRNINFKKCKGAVVSETDPNVLVASLQGQPILLDRGVEVDDVYEVNDVDLHTGHVDYDGSVVIKGNVISGMKVKASGDVQIYGLVENAMIESGGNVDIKLGAVGREDDETGNQMEIHCAGNLSANYLENIKGYVQGDVLIKSRVSNSVINAGHQVVVGNRRQEKSGIVGGKIVAGDLIRAEVLGSDGGTLTDLVVAYDTAGMSARKIALKKQVTDLNTKLMSVLGKTMSASKKKTEASAKKVEQLKLRSEEIKEQVSELISEQDELEQEAELLKSNVERGRVIAQKEIHGGVTIKIADQDVTVNSKYKQGMFVLDKGRLSFKAAID